MAKLLRVVLSLAVGLVFAAHTTTAGADQHLNHDADFQKGLAIGAALAHQSAELGFGEWSSEEQLPSATPRTVGLYDASTISTARSPRLSDLMGFTTESSRAPRPAVTTRHYTLADALADWRWRRNVAADLRERLD